MRQQHVKSFSQGRNRTIFHLDCGHNFFMGLMSNPSEVAFCVCDQCPDETPQEVRVQRSATELFRRAGEPDV
jgi:hypothetical protein